MTSAAATRLRNTLWIAALATFASSAARAQCALELVVPPTGHAAQLFGNSYALHDDLVVVGAYAEQSSGAVYAYRRGPHGLGIAQRLVAFGSTVATDGVRVLTTIGPSAAGSSGVAVFAPAGNSLAFEQLLEAPAPSSQFGSALAIAGDRLALRSSSGRIDLYERIAGVWTLATSLQKANGAPYMANCRLLFHGARLYVYRDVWTNNDDHVEIWLRTQQGWAFETRLLGDGTSSTGDFGASLAVSGDRIAVGEPEWAGFGRVVVHQRVGAAVVVIGSFAAPEARRLGAEVSFDGARIVATEPLYQGAAGRGAVSVYQEQPSGWTEVEFHERPANLPPTIGWEPIALAGTSFLSRATLPPAGTGLSLDVLALIGVAPRTDLRFCPTTVNSTGLQGRIEVEGTRSVAALDTALVARHVPGSAFALFVYGPREGQAPLGNGYLCIDLFGGGLVRVNPPVLADASGIARTPFSPGNAPVGAPLEAGRSYVFQAWYRDAAGGGALYNLTDALRVTFCP